MDAPEKTNWLLVFMLLVAGLFAAAQFGKLTLTLEVMQARYRSQAHLVSVLVTIVGLVGIVFGAVAGSVVTRIGVTRALTTALCLGGILSILQAGMPSFTIFAVLRIIEGFSHLAIVVAAPTLIASCTSNKDRPVAMGVWASFFGLSLAISALFIPGLLSIGRMPAVMLAHGFGMLVVAVLLYPLLPKARISDPVPISYSGEHRIIYSRPALMVPGLVFVWYTLIYIALLAILPGLLDLPLWSISMIPLISLAGTFLAGFLARFIAPLHIAVIGFVGTAVFMIGVGTQANPLIAVFALMLIMGLVPGACFAAIPYFNDPATDRARATGCIAQMGNVGTTLGTPIFVLAAQSGGRLAVMTMTIGFCLIALLIITLFRRRLARA